MVSAPLNTEMDAAERADLREAYDRGRRDERDSRKRHPVGMTLLVAAAIVGAAILALAAFNGSFGRAGLTVDRNLDSAAQRAEPAVRAAAADAGQAVRDAGATVRDSARDAAR